MSAGVLPGTIQFKQAAHRIPGAHRRFYWRVRHRQGANWSEMTDRQIAAELRRMSHRRTL